MNFGEVLTNFGKGFVFVCFSIFFIWAAKYLADRRTKEFDDDAQIDDGNKAVGIRRAGFYLAIAIALAGTLQGISKGFLVDLIYLAVDGTIILLCLFSCRYINDRIMLGHIRNDRECVRIFTTAAGRKETGNTAVGIVEACMYIATGFVLNGSLSGTGNSFLENILSTLLFFVLGQLVLLLFGLIYELITPLNLRNEIENNNPAAGLSLGGVLVALGIILKGSISGPFTGWINDIASFGMYTAYGFIMLLLFRAVIDRLLLPTTTLAAEIEKEKNLAAVVVTESAINAVAVMIAFSM